MELKFLCGRCGKEVHPYQVSFEEAENINSDAFFRKADMHYSINPCDCLFDVDRDIFEAVQKAISDIKANK